MNISLQIKQIKALLEEQQTIIAENDKLGEKNESQFKNGRITKDVAGENREKLKGKRLVLKDYVRDNLDKIMKDILDKIVEWEKPTGEQMNVEDIKLLDGSITLTKEEVQDLGDKHKANPVMQRILREYADKHEFHFMATADGKAKKKALNMLAEQLKSATEDPLGYTGRLFSPKHFDETIKLYGDLTGHEHSKHLPTGDRLLI